MAIALSTPQTTPPRAPNSLGVVTEPSVSTADDELLTTAAPIVAKDDDGHARAGRADPTPCGGVVSSE